MPNQLSQAARWIRNVHQSALRHGLSDYKAFELASDVYEKTHPAADRMQSERIVLALLRGAGAAN